MLIRIFYTKIEIPQFSEFSICVSIVLDRCRNDVNRFKINLLNKIIN